MKTKKLTTDRFIQEEDMKTSSRRETFVSGVFEARIFQNGIRMKTIGYTVNNKSFSEELKGITEISTSVIIPPKRLRKLINLLLEAEDFYNNKTIDLQPIKWFEVFYWPINTIKHVLTYFKN